jgi:hypothetical protein
MISGLALPPAWYKLPVASVFWHKERRPTVAAAISRDLALENVVFIRKRRLNLIYL